MNYEEVYAASLEYFKGDDLAAGVFADKYALRDKECVFHEKTPDDMHRRLAREFARIEAKYPNPLSEDQIYEYFKDFKWIVPQGSPMSAIGNPHQVQSAGNCFVIETWDSYGGILKTDQELVQIAKRRGGIGFDLSQIRPKGAFTNNAAKTTDGIAVFMQRYSNSTREVAQSGRRGALLMSLSVHHPEILTFATIKNDPTKVTGANISIRLTDEFMTAVKRGEKYQLRWPVDAKEPVISEMVDAGEVWKTIIHSAWFRAEPGLLFWDTILRESPADCYVDAGYKTLSTNPCQPGFATVLTKEGIRTFDDIGIDSEIWSESGWTRVVRKISSGKKPVYAVKSNAGIFVGTENHEVLSNGTKVECLKAKSLDILTGKFVYALTSFDPLAMMDGLLVGDGSTHLASLEKVYLTVGEKDQDYFNDEILGGHFIEPHAVNYKKAWKVKHSLGVQDLPPLPVRRVPVRYLRASENVKLSFLRGLYSANGSICGKRVTLKATSIEMIRDVQLMLNSLNMVSYVTKNKVSKIKWLNGVYESKESYDLNISTDRNIFANKIGFIQKYKTEKLRRVILTVRKGRAKKVNYDIVSREFLGEHDVFDITVDNAFHTYWTGGINVGNCGELPISKDSCRLITINWLSFVENPFTDKAKFNFEKFSEVAQAGQRLMDDLVDLELELITKIITKVEQDPEPQNVKQTEFDLWTDFRKQCKNGRRTGLGPVAVGDCLAALGIRYGSKESIRKLERIYKAQAVASYTASIIMAEERGAFPVFNHKLEKDHVFVSRVLEACDEKTQKLYRKFGRRNIANLTTAPTGSVAVMTQTTSGIEPVPFLSYTRRKKVSPDDKNARIDFVDKTGDSWQEFEVVHPGILRWKAVSGETDITKSPYYKATAMDLDWHNKIQMQAAAQKWVDHAISNTTNLPNDVSEEVVADIYMTGWESGCKGVTVYREGCRSGVLVQTPDNVPRNVFGDVHAPKRPKSLPANVYTFMNKGDKWVGILGLFEGRPYELFTGLSEPLTLVGTVESGEIIKRKSGVYDFIYKDGHDKEHVIEGLGSCFDSEYYNYGKFVSSVLRHGMPIPSVVELVSKIKLNEDHLNTWKAGVARILKKFIADGTAAQDAKCESCGDPTGLIYQEGCLKCKSCGYSKCG